MAIPPVPAPTVESIQAAKDFQARERERVYRETGVKLDHDGRPTPPKEQEPK